MAPHNVPSARRTTPDWHRPVSSCGNGAAHRKVEAECPGLEGIGRHAWTQHALSVILALMDAACLHRRAVPVYNWRMQPAAFQRNFLRQLGDYRPLQQLLDLLPDVAFFVKDRRGRFVLSSRRATDCCRVDSEGEVIGKCDRDFFPDDRCALYRQQDQQVMRSGKPIINAVCPTPEEGSDALIIFSKVPLRDRRGRVIGIAGIHRELRGQRTSPPLVGRIARAVAIMQERYAVRLRITELAAAARLSRSQFDRQFRKLFGTTPREYLQRVRVSAACRLLENSTQKTTQIALATGFYDHSHFSRTFRRIMGTTPIVFRRRHSTEGRARP